MNKKIIITIVAVILIIALAIAVGKNLSKGDTQPTNTNPVNNETSTPNDENSTPTPETAFPETPTPDASRETPTPTPTVEPSTNPSPSVDISKMDKNQKIEYAQSIAKKTWEKNNTNRNGHTATCKLAINNDIANSPIAYLFFLLSINFSIK